MPEAAAGSEPRTAALLVTSENREQFMQKRMDLKAPPSAPAAEPAAAPPSTEAKKESAAEPKAEPAPKAEEKKEPPAQEPADTEIEGDIQVPEKKQRFRGRISELTQKRKEAEAKAEAAQKEATEAKRRAAEAEAKLAPPPPAPLPAKTEELVEPQRQNFASESEYIDARVDYAAEKKIRARDAQAAESQAKAAHEARLKTYQERLTAVRAEVPDFDAKIAAQKDMPIPPHIGQALIESAQGPRLALYFADHPAEATRIVGLSPVAALVELGKIEAMIETQRAAPAPAKEPASAPAAPKLEVSAAPPPISPIKASANAEPEAKLDSAGNFRGTYAEFKALRRAGKLK